MEDFVVTSRAPIADLNLPTTQETSQILLNFDMYREVCTGMIRDSVNFAYLEHLMRISTTETETTEAVRQFPRTLQYKISEILELKKELAQEVIHMLQTSVTKEDIKLVKANVIQVNHKWDGRKLYIEEFEEGGGKMLPVVYTLTMKNRYYLLYTPNMSYIDGYEAFDGSVKINYIPESTLPQLTAEFYRFPSNKSVQTEESKKKKKEEEKKQRLDTKSAIMTPRTPEVSIAKQEEPKSMVVNFPGKLNLESIGQSQVEEVDQYEEYDQDLEDEEDQYSEEESEKVLKKNRVKLEKTWEKYEKKAAYQKKEGSFNPCDCRII